MGGRASSPSGSSTSTAWATSSTRASCARTRQTVVGFVTILVIVFLLANLLVDLLYAVLDPRIRYA